MMSGSWQDPYMLNKLNTSNSPVYASKTIANQKWLFISYRLCDFTAKTKQRLFY